MKRLRMLLVDCVTIVGLCLWATSTAFSADEGSKASRAAAEPAKIDKPLLAYWTFDERFGVNCLDSSGNRHTASPEQKQTPGFERTQGVFGSGAGFAGQHMLRVAEMPAIGALAKTSFSVWVMPGEWGHYNEIFRKEDGDRRVLFSFQEKGTILSLGLNVSGYVECDAPINPAQVADGRWHHCAATFDGRFMRVYLDGKQIGSLERPGRITAGGAAPGCIGSSQGGECFVGAMDELRIYKDTLTPEEVAQIHRNGLESLAKTSESVDGGELQLDLSPLAHWKFNEGRATSTIRDVSGAPGLTIGVKGNAGRTKGVFGNALSLRGKHSLEVGGGLLSGEMPQISFSAWARPSDLSGYREIYRQECPERLLFSFQENGSILSLGLNIGGYQECDAEIDRAQVLDGRWHHCAATFDGQFMRVYLDGKEVGRCERPGKIAVQAGPHAFIGSSSGEGECFQGSLDDLRIYAKALTPEQVRLLHQSGVRSMTRVSKEIEAQLKSVYLPKKTFAETFAACRKNLADQNLLLVPDLVEAILARLKAGFAEDYTNFVTWSGADPIEYVTSKDNEVNLREAGRLVDLLVEYKPLTESQWKKQTPEELRKWEQVEVIAKKFETLKAQGNAAAFSPAWIEVILQAGAKIQFRPHVAEAVAPYLKPETPPVRNLSSDEAREALQRDWLHQANQTPTPARIKSEIQWTRRLAARIAAGGKADFAKELARLKDLEKQAGAIPGPDPALYFQVRQIKRAIALKNPAVDFSKVLLVDMPFPQGSEWRHETRHRLGYMAVPGGRLLILDGLAPDGKLAQLMPQPPLHGSFWRPDVSFDGKKVLFSYKPHNEKSFHIYEIGVDGSALTQVTDGPYDDFDPVYLPDGQHILFSTTRGHTYVRCMPPTNAYVLARCQRDGKNLYLVSYNNEPDYLPSVMNDGRVVYTRWEYTDKPLWRAQKLWTMNPDGTQVSTYWGNQSVWPDLLKDARSIPGSRRVMFTGSAHHDWFSGSVGIIDPDGGYNFPDGLTKVTADVAWPESGNGPVDPIECRDYHASGDYPAYYSPYPLSERDFLVSAQRNGRFILYLMDVEGNREMIYEGVNNVFHASPVKPRVKPPLIADRVAWPDKKDRLNPKHGVIFSNNVYHGAPPELKGKAKYLRVLHIDPKTYTYWHKRPYISTGPVVSIVQSEGVKRILGTVPIADDGSVAFSAPPGMALHFQLLDADYRALHTMRSFVGLMPGERRGCLGCHESHSRAPHVEGRGLALAREPQPITPPPWGEDTVSYARYVQPVLDKYCGKCHQGNGEGVKAFDLTPRRGFLDFQEPYFIMTGRPTWGRPYEKPPITPPGWGIANVLMVEAFHTVDPEAYKTPKPMTYLSYKSRLIELASSGKHYNVKADPTSLQRLIAWIDAMCPYCGDEEVREIPDPTFQGVDWLSVRPRVKTAPRIVRPGPID